MAWEEPRLALCGALTPAEAGEGICTGNCQCHLLYQPGIKTIAFHLFSPICCEPSSLVIVLPDGSRRPQGCFTCTHRRVLWVSTSTGHFFPVLPQPAGRRSMRELAYALEATWRPPQTTTHCAEAPGSRPTNPLSYALLAPARCCGTAHLVLILSLLQPFILGLRQVSLVPGGRSICVSLLLPYGPILCSLR